MYGMGGLVRTQHVSMIHTYIRIYVYTYMHTCIHTYVYVYTYTFLHTYIRVHAYILIDRYRYIGIDRKRDLEPAILFHEGCHNVDPTMSLKHPLYPRDFLCVFVCVTAHILQDTRRRILFLYIYINIHTHRHTHRHTDTQTDRQTHTPTHTHIPPQGGA